MDKPRSVSLIDGAWLDRAKEGLVSDNKWDLQNFAERLIPNYHWRFRTYYFDAMPYKDRHNPSELHKQRYQEKDEWLTDIERLERFTVRRGYCKQSTAKGYVRGGGFQAEMTEIVTIEQKMVDVLLSTEMTRIATSIEAQHIGLVAGDGDYIAAVEAARNAGAIVRLFFVRRSRTSVAPELYDAVDERVDIVPILEEMESQQ